MRKFMRTRSATRGHDVLDGAPLPGPAPVHNGHAATATPHTNGHAKGAGVSPAHTHTQRDEHTSTLSRYWHGSRSSAASQRGPGGLEGVQGGLWKDEEFPATWRSIGDKRLAADVVWMRPHELYSRPRFFGDETLDAAEGDEESCDRDERDFADRWVVEYGAWWAPGGAGGGAVAAAASALALTPRLLARVAPPHSFSTGYTGAFRFQLWVFGSWVTVVVDDRLPTRRGRLLAARSAAPADFTLPLLEKAYAKLYGGYSCLREGSVSRALQDLTGGVVQSFALALHPPHLTFQVLNSAAPRSTLLVATTTAVAGHQPCCVTGLARVGAGDEERGALVRVRAASARAAWRGAWSRGSREWRALPEPDRELLAERAPHTADSWMSFSDFVRHFTSLELVHVGPDDWMSEPALHGKRPWRAVLARRRWRQGYNAGGPPRCTETTGTNPQFHLQIPGAGVGAGVESGRKCHVVVSVTQRYCPRGSERLRGIGFAVYELPAGAESARGARLSALLPALRPLDVTHVSRAREVVTFFTLPPGAYALVPHTQLPHQETAFLLRVYTDERADVWEVNEDNVVVRSISSEFLDERQPLPPEVRMSVAKLLGKREIEEVDAVELRAALRRVWRSCLAARPSLELCRALLTLRDTAIAGRMPARDLPALFALLAFWKHTFVRVGCGGEGGRMRCGASASRCSSYRLRALLWACGVTASNKVVECLVVRFTRRATLTHEAYLMALARLHLAHERYRSLDSKMKSNPLSLEEMILMTIYS